MAARDIKNAAGRSLPVPSATKWNSFYDALKVLVTVLSEHMIEVNRVCRAHSLSAFTTSDKEVYSEYVTVMKPVAYALDQLQGEKHAFMGILLPTLHILR